MQKVVVTFLSCPYISKTMLNILRSAFLFYFYFWKPTNRDMLEPLGVHVHWQIRVTLNNLPENLSAYTLKAKVPHCREDQRRSGGRCVCCNTPVRPPGGSLWASQEIKERDNHLPLHCDVCDVTVHCFDHEFAFVFFSLCLDFDVLHDVRMLSHCPGF